MNFIPLHIYTGYTFLDSGIKINDLINEARNDGYTTLAICDKNVMFGFAEFNKICRNSGIKPIFGMDLEVDNNLFSLFIKDENGYKNLCYLSSIYQKNNKVTYEELKEKTNGLLCVFSINNPLFKEVKENTFAHDLNIFAKVFKDFYLGIEIYTKFEIDKANLIRNFAQKYNYETIAFPLIKYIKKDDAIVLNLLDAIKRQSSFDYKSEIKDSHFFFKNQEEITKFYSPLELLNTTKLFSELNFVFEIKRGDMLHFSNEKDYVSKDTLKEEILKGLKEKNIDLKKEPNYRNRLNGEFIIIEKMGYCDYFLIVQDYVRFAKKNNIPVGPGRGSAAGSLISYLLGITDADPLKYNLLFERFLNPYRKTMPDIDIDFSDTRREEIFSYLINKYGKERCARVIAFQTFGAKQALRDTTKAYGYPNQIADEICKTIPNNYNATGYDLDFAYNNIPAFKNTIDNTVDYKMIFKAAHMIEGLPRQKGMHAAGIILDNNDLSDKMPLCYVDENTQMTQFEKDYLEPLGFLKMDILGLTNLTTIQNCIDIIKRERGITINLDKIDYSDPSIYKLITENRTMGIFQLDTSAALNAINQIKPTSFNDVVATISLDRPGPMAQIPSYSRRKHGLEKVDFLDDSIKPILIDTYGIIVYQEQVMQIARVFSGFSLAGADLFRRAISKKHKDEMLKMKDKFIKGAIDNKHNVRLATQIYNMIEKFASYGFNKSHAVCYALIACQEAYLKTKFGPEFYMAILDQEYGSNDAKFIKYLAEIKKSKIDILLPNINQSSTIFRLINDKLLMPLTGITGLPIKVVYNILEERKKNGTFKDFFNFVIRMVNTDEKITEVQLSKLIDAGVFDTLYKNRKALKLSILDALDKAKTVGYSDNKIDWYGLEPFKCYEVDDDPLERINNEYQALGAMISDSPLLHINKDLLQNKIITEINDLLPQREVNIVGIIRSIKVIQVKKGKDAGKPMAFLLVYDETGEIDTTLFSSDYAIIGSHLKSGDITLIQGKTQIRNEKLNLTISNINIIGG